MRSAHRRLCGFCLLLYAFVGVGLPFADGLLAANGGPVAAHVEDAGNPHPAGHDHVSCQICRALERNSALDRAPSLVMAVASARRLRIEGARLVVVDAPGGRTTEARAPPRA